MQISCICVMGYWGWEARNPSSRYSMKRSPDLKEVMIQHLQLANAPIFAKYDNIIHSPFASLPQVYVLVYGEGVDSNERSLYGGCCARTSRVKQLPPPIKLATGSWLLMQEAVSSSESQSKSCVVSKTVCRLCFSFAI